MCPSVNGVLMNRGAAREPGSQSQIWRMPGRRHLERHGTREPYSNNFLSTEKALAKADDAGSRRVTAGSQPKQGAVTGSCERRMHQAGTPTSAPQHQRPHHPSQRSPIPNTPNAGT